ncbi:hypothetical protein [Phenylobacterium sp.]|jgi:hypothetical protein|uniref:hypothetical protein n=1 Tax=Phenylobacterium sp. TaxID=1871053 RepID=UPI0037C51931
MRNANLTLIGLWTFRLAIVLSMIVVDDPFRLAAAALLLALQIPLHARISMQGVRAARSARSARAAIVEVGTGWPAGNA